MSYKKKLIELIKMKTDRINQDIKNITTLVLKLLEPEIHIINKNLA